MFRRALIFIITLPTLASPAQAQAPDVAYVDGAIGRSVVRSAGTEREIEFLDTLRDGAEIVVEAGAELRLCAYHFRRLVTVAGPASLRLSHDGFKRTDGRAVPASREPCAPPVQSTMQGGMMLRGGEPPRTIAARTWIRVVSRERPVREAVLSKMPEGPKVVQFTDVTPHPVELEDGTPYRLVVTMADGTTETQDLIADKALAAGILIVTAP